MLDLGEFRYPAKILRPVYRTTNYGEKLVDYWEVAYTVKARRRDIEWSTIGEEAHGKQLVVEARTEYYIKKYRPDITEDYVVLQNNFTYEITRVDDFDYGRYTRLVALRRDNLKIAEDTKNPGQYIHIEL